MTFDGKKNDLPAEVSSIFLDIPSSPAITFPTARGDNMMLSMIEIGVGSRLIVVLVRPATSVMPYFGSKLLLQLKIVNGPLLSFNILSLIELSAPLIN